MKSSGVILTAVATGVIITGWLVWPGPLGKSLDEPHVRSKAGPNVRSGDYKRSPSLVAITNTEIHWEERIREIARLPQDLDPSLIQGLFDFLSTKPQEEVQETWYVVANELMEVLRQRELASGLYTRELSSLIKNTAIDPVIRDYAIQHLSQWISGAAPDSRETDTTQIMAAFDLICEQAADPRNGQLTLVGTALNALTDAHRNGQGPILESRKRLQSIALSIAATTDSSVAPFNRSTALQAAALLEAPELPKLCRDLAGQDTAAPDLRLSSVAALGLVGDSVDLPLLRSFVADSPFHYAAAAAIKRIEDRDASR